MLHRAWMTGILIAGLLLSAWAVGRGKERALTAATLERRGVGVSR